MLGKVFFAPGRAFEGQTDSIRASISPQSPPSLDPELTDVSPIHFSISLKKEKHFEDFIKVSAHARIQPLGSVVMEMEKTAKEFVTEI